MDFDRFVDDPKTCRSVIYSLQCISEAAVKLGDHAEKRAPDEDWRNIRGFGNIARHDYGAVNLEMVWDIVQQGLPPLEVSCRRVLASIEERSDPADGQSER